MQYVDQTYASQVPPRAIQGAQASYRQWGFLKLTSEVDPALNQVGANWCHKWWRYKVGQLPGSQGY